MLALALHQIAERRAAALGVEGAAKLPDSPRQRAGLEWALSKEGCGQRGDLLVAQRAGSRGEVGDLPVPGGGVEDVEPVDGAALAQRRRRQAPDEGVLAVPGVDLAG